MTQVLVTGGAGYIGAHVAAQLMEEGYGVAIIDSISHGDLHNIEGLRALYGDTFGFEYADIRDCELLKNILEKYKINAVIHLAGLKSVTESHAKPLEYFDVNTGGTIAMLRAIEKSNVDTFLFSSSATVYGVPRTLPIDESHGIGQTESPYGTSKYLSERIIHDCCKRNPKLSTGVLRYFNPLGGHPSNLLREINLAKAENIMPALLRSLGTADRKFTIHGKDYPTIDGTPVRDYIHVCDLADAHLRAFETISNYNKVAVWNVGSGVGTTVLELVRAFEHAAGEKLAVDFGVRRPGDVPVCFANIRKAKTELGWEPKRSVMQMMLDSVRSQS